MSRFGLTAERVFDGEIMRTDVAVVIEGARIVEVVAKPKLDSSVPLQDLGKGMLAPGFIDLQVNGGGGILLNATPTLEGVRAIAKAHRRFGTTGLLPTVITDAPKVMEAAATAVSQAIRQGMPGVLGIHIEGPFIDPARKGAHAEQFIRRAADRDEAWLKSLDCGEVLVTLAPNCVAPDFIRELNDAGITVSLGHSDATAEQALAALEAGATGFTHLFNAMSQMTGRAPGMVGAALAHVGASCGIIADGHHVDPVALRAAIAAYAAPQKQYSQIFFVSDAMPSAAGGPDRFTLQGRPAEVVAGRLQLADGTLAGANITMRDAVRYGIGQLELDLEQALAMASLRPAQYLGLGDKLGRLRHDQRANLVHLTDDLDVLETWIDGKATEET